MISPSDHPLYRPKVSTLPDGRPGGGPADGAPSTRVAGPAGEGGAGAANPGAGEPTGWAEARVRFRS